MNDLDKLKDKLGKAAGLLPKSQAVQAGICVKCRKPALERCYSDAGRREYQISGMCELCFDKCFEEE